MTVSIFSYFFARMTEKKNVYFCDVSQHVLSEVVIDSYF